MGSFLDKPVTEKETVKGSGNDLIWACSAMQGWRVDMEDSHTCETDVSDMKGTGFYCVFDGHGGDMVANISCKDLLPMIQSLDLYKNGDKDAENLKKSLYDGLLAHDRKMRLVPVLASGEDHSGCTAITSFVTPTDIIIGNTGDSRAVLCRGGKVHFGTTDHKPTDDIETKRVQRAGGFIENQRVCGNLAVSRALGDYQYKDRPDLPDEDQKITAAPDMTVIKRDEEDEYLLLCCDGIWDVVSNAEACDYVTSCLKGGLSPEQISEQFIDYCLELNSKDNMSVLIILFPNAPKKVEGHRAPEPPFPDQQKQENDPGAEAFRKLKNAAQQHQ